MWNLRDIGEVAEEILGRSNVLFDVATAGIRTYMPHFPKMGYEKTSRFFLLKNPSDWYPLPNINTPRSAEAKIELHEAVRAGTHLDLRIKIGTRVYDFAIVKTDKLPTETGKVQRVVVRNNHSLRYFNAESHVFEEGQYGYGKMATIFRGKIDILYSDETKIEFEILEGDFKGRYCLRTEKDTIMPETIIRMKDDSFIWKERRPYIDSQSALSKAKLNQNDYIATQKIDGANFTIIPGPKANGIYSRRLSVTGNPINRANNMPQLKHMKFPSRYHGKRIHVEIVDGTHSSSKTAGLLNSNPSLSRSKQISSGNFLQAYIYDLEGEGTYSERREEYQELANSSPRRDWRSFGVDVDKFLFKRATNPRILKPVCGSDVHPVMVHVGNEFVLVEEPSMYSDLIKAQDSEGTVWIAKKSLYHDSSPWIKDKKVNTFDLKVVDITEGMGRHSGSLGALIVENTNGKTTNVGTGFSDELRQEIFDNKDQWIGSTIEVAGLEETHHGGIRAPRFVRQHLDK